MAFARIWSAGAVAGVAARGASAALSRQAALVGAPTGRLMGVRYLSSWPEHVVLPMPALSPTMEAGNIASIEKAVGDEVAAGDALAEIETDKATVAFESTDDGYVAAILVEEGAQDVPVGTPVLVMVEEEEDVAAFANFTAADAGAVPAGEDTASAPTVDEGAAPPAPEPVAAPQPAAPSAAPAAAAAPQEAPAKPAAPAAAAPAQAEGEEQLAFASWGHSILSSPISKTVLAAQDSYTELYGSTLMEIASPKEQGADDA